MSIDLIVSKSNPKTGDSDSHQPPDKAETRRRILAKQGRQYEEELVEVARNDPAAFTTYVFRHEKTQRQIRNAPFHEQWHEFLSNTTWGVISAAIEHGKTIQIGQSRLLWEIGRNPNIRCLLVGANDEAAEKNLQAIINAIDRNPRVRKVFPHLRRMAGRGYPWNKRDMTVQRDSLARDPTIQARGQGSKNILGSRLDLIIIDDLLCWENTHTKYQRDAIHEWLDDVITTRVNDDWAQGDLGRVWFIGNPWDSDDLIARLSGLPGWQTMTTPAVLNPGDPPSRWIPTWPEQWPLERLLVRRAIMLPHTFARKYLCMVMSDAERRFKKAWIDHMLKQGEGRYLLDRQPTGPGGRLLRCFTGVDFGIGKKRSDAETVLFTIALIESRRVLVGLKAGRWTGPEILQRCARTSRRYDSVVCTESNAAQKWMGEFASDFEGIPVVQLHTGRNKWDEQYGVESLAVEMQAGLWIAPSGEYGQEIDEEVREWVREMLEYDPSSHTGDRLMAAWKAREGARLHGLPVEQPSQHTRR
jgi:hypothetical protein